MFTDRDEFVVFMLICFVGLLFVAIALPKALRPTADADDEVVPPVIDDIPAAPPYWQKHPAASAHATDEMEYLQMLERYHAHPGDYPAPIPYSQPGVDSHNPGD